MVGDPLSEEERGQDMAAIGTSQPRTSVSRRRFIGLSLLAGAGVVVPATSGRTDDGGPWREYTSSLSGASVRYPGAWGLDEVLVPALVEPAQSFAVRSGPAVPGGADLPALTDYSSDAVLAWVLHDPRIIEGEPLDASSLPQSLIKTPSEFDHLDSYIADFAGSDRSYILRVWIGVDASDTTKSLLDRCLSSISVP